MSPANLISLMSNSITKLVPETPEHSSRMVKGIGGSPGVAVAPALVIRSRVLNVPERRISATETEAEWLRFEAASSKTRAQLNQLRSKLDTETRNGEAGILDAHLMVLDDEALVQRVRQEIFDKRRNAEAAVRNVANYFIKQFLRVDDPYLRERAEDIADVGRRFIRNLLGISDEIPLQWGDDCIVVAANLTPSETIAMPRDRVRGFALDRGSTTSHAALIARALGIPAVFGLGNISTSVKSGDIIGLDGSRGVVFVNPPPSELRRLEKMAEARATTLRELGALRDLPATTPDGRNLPLYANIENVSEMAAIETHGAEGIGLFRTEYLWLASGRPVSEEQQTAAYMAAVRALKGKPLVVRAFDLGGDKFSGSHSHLQEENPFLGLRSIRYLLRHPEIFKAQMRAVLRARAEGEVQIMFPMISHIDELHESREMLNACKHDILSEGIDCPAIKIGTMIEVPSAALMADTWARYCDFFSIGTNDLTQYTLAVDRNNAHVAHLYHPTHPAVIRLIAHTIEAGHRHNIPVAVCGEMASNPATALLLLGMGIDSLSMAPAAISSVKEAIRKTTLIEARDLAQQTLAAETADEIMRLCCELLNQVAPNLAPLT